MVLNKDKIDICEKSVTKEEGKEKETGLQFHVVLRKIRLSIQKNKPPADFMSNFNMESISKGSKKICFKKID